MKRALFIHRSVGHCLLKYGKLRALLIAQSISLDDYDNNNGLLTQSNGSKVNGSLKMPGDNTNPENLAAFFQAWPSLLDTYDLIMIKSCYPNSHITDNLQVNKIEQCYKTIFEAFNDHDKHLLIITTPPLRPAFTNANEAKLASDLADWLVSSEQSNIHVFDMHHAYAEPTGRNKGMLKRSYRRLLPWDNHPNRKAHKAIVLQLTKMITEA